MLDSVLSILQRSGVSGEDETGTGNRLILSPGDVLVKEGDKSQETYILVEGALQATRRMGDENVVVATVDRPGSPVGELAALGGGERTATVTALADCVLIELGYEELRGLLAEHPDLGEALAITAVRRAEENELIEVLSEHYLVRDADSLAAACARVEWRRLMQGQVLFREGEPSDQVYIVVRGRLGVTRHDPLVGEERRVGVVGRGDPIGEIGVLRGQPRGATVTALRDSVIAGLSEPRFLELVERQPRLLVELGARAVTRAETVERRSTASNVIALLNLTGAELVGPFVDALAPFGVVETIDASRIDRQLGVEGIADSAAGEPGEVSVSRLLREAEMAAEHLILDIGDGLGAFAQRCMGTADRLLIALPSEPSLEILEKARAKLTRAPSGLERWICLIHQSVDATPGGTGAIVDALGATAVVHAVFGDAGSFQRAARVFAGRGNVLVLSGGGGRGFAHIGVVRALNELGIPIDIVGGTSMGAILGAAIADGLTPDALVEWAHRHFPRSLDYTFPVVGLVKAGRIVESARHTFGNRTIEDLWRGYFAVSTDLTTARIHVHRRGRIDVVVRATSAIPGVMPPVPFGSSLLVDGGVLNNLPIDVARDDSPGGQVIAVDVAPSQGPRAHSDYGLAVSGWKALGAGLGGRRSPFPRISAVLMRSMITASLRERDDLVQGGLADCYLPLDMRGVSMLDFSDPRGVAERGYETAMPFLTAWLEGRSVTDRESDRR